MRFIKKINLGLILAIIAITAVVVYSVNVESGRKSAKEDIKKVCEEFINLTDKYSILPTEYQVVGIQNANVDLNNFYSEMKVELNKVTTTEASANIQKTILSEALENQMLNTTNITTNFNREITKISSYAFDGNQVTVTFNSKITIKQKYNDVNVETGELSEKIKEDSFESNGETITLEQKDGKWKVVSANLSYNSLSSFADMMFMM